MEIIFLDLNFYFNTVFIITKERETYTDSGEESFKTVNLFLELIGRQVEGSKRLK